MSFIESLKAKLAISEDSKQKMKYIFLLMLSITLIILSFLNIRSGSDDDDKKTTDIISSINICSYIILILSLPILGRCLWFFYTIREGQYYKEIEIFDKLLVFVFPLVILIVSIVLKVYVSNYLPDMNNPYDVEKYNKTHVLNAESVNNSSNAILVIGIILFIMSIGFAYYTAKSLPPSKPADVKDVKDVQQHPVKLTESQFDKEMRELARDRDLLEKEVKGMRELYKKQEVTEDLLNEYEFELGKLNLNIKEKQAKRAKEKKDRDEELKKRLLEQEETYRKSTQKDILSSIKEKIQGAQSSKEMDISKYKVIETSTASSGTPITPTPIATSNIQRTTVGQPLQTGQTGQTGQPQRSFFTPQ
jgi:hypothetical protein